MSYNFIGKDAEIKLSPRCVHDTCIGYESDFSENGNVDGWEYYSGIHTYGCWNNFIFATLYGSSALIGRFNVFRAVPAETHYTIKITMKFTLADRPEHFNKPAKGRVMWVTLANPVWGEDKIKDFTIYPDGQWHVYILNMGEEQWWQGDVNNLRIYPILYDGVDGDEFFIKNIQITSVENWECRNITCDYYVNYSHPCGGIGVRGRCESSPLDVTVDNVTLGPDGEELFFTIEENINDELVVNINGYGNEIVRFDSVSEASGLELVKIVAKNIAKTNIGGYNEVEVEYDSENKKFIIHSGTYNDNSSVKVVSSKAAVILGFFDNEGADLSSRYLGQTPVNGFLPLSTFRLGTAQLLGFFDNDSDTTFEFDPSIYNVEGGRSDWLSSGFGDTENAIAGDQNDTSGAVVRHYNIIDNSDKTIIDFCHPFNASGRIKKIYVACTLEDLTLVRGVFDTYEYSRRDAETEGASVKIFRLKRDGRLEVIHSIGISDRDRTRYGSGGLIKLYSSQQEAVIFDCDLWVNKGDLLGVYGAHLYAGKHVTGNEVGALYYQIDGEVYSKGQVIPYTKNLCTGGTIIESGHSGDFVKENAFDGNYGTSWQSDTADYGWLTYDFGEGNEKIIKQLRLKASSKSVYDFNIQASNDDTYWVTLLTECYNSHIREAYDVPNSAAFRYYKLTVTSSYQDYKPTIADIELKAAGWTTDTSSIFDPGILHGQGSSGLLIYARSDVFQHKTAIDVDLGHRINIKDVTIKGKPKSEILEFNIARCLDINWKVDLFGGTHKTGYVVYVPQKHRVHHTHPNLCYGIDKLTDGIFCVPDGLTADNFSMELVIDGAMGGYGDLPPGMGKGMIPVNPRYFFVNGDTEWLGVYQWAGLPEPFVVDFEEDPIAFTLKFPYRKLKKIYKSRTYFKEQYNFRSFALSTYLGPIMTNGNADDPHFKLIPEYTAVTLDNVRMTKKENVGTSDLYLFVNPSIGHAIFEQIGDTIIEYDDNTAYWDPMHGLIFYSSAIITNNEQYLQAMQIDWNVLEHEWEPIDCEGFRFYCNYHRSTKITEMELYCIAGEAISAMAGSITILQSKYQEMWWPVPLTQNDDGSVTAFVGDTPRYFTIEIQPILTIRLEDVVFNADIKDVYVGEKGCAYDLLLDNSETDVVNPAQKINIKNVYGRNYDLYVDISSDKEREEGSIFYSKLNDETSIYNPEVGPDAFYRKEDDYPLVNQQGNCAINCECYGLKNLIDGKKAYCSQDDMCSWYDFGTLTENTDIGSSNVASIGVSLFSLPVLLKNRYWKIGFLCHDASVNVREMKVYYENVEQDCVFYHDKNLEYENGPVFDTAPHLNNGSVTGSYYKLMDDHYIGFDLLSVDKIDKITLFHTHLSTHCGSICGIDKYTSLCLQGRGEHLSDDIVDYSYHEHDVENIGDVCISKLGGGDLFEGGVASAYSYHPPYVPEYAVDNNLGNQESGYASVWYSVDIPTWWKYDFGEDKAVVGNRLIMRCAYSTLYIPTNFDIQGSNNDVDWVTFPTASGLSVTGDARFNAFDFPNTTPYRYYRIYIFCCTPMIRELELLYYEPGLGSKLPLEGLNGGISFPGTEDDYLRIPYSECLFVDGSDYTYPDYMHFSMDFWINFRSYPTSKIYLMGGVFWISLEHKGGDTIRMEISRGAAESSFPLGAWRRIHIHGSTAVNYGSLQIYIDGTQHHSSGWSSNEATTWGTDGSDLLVGRLFDGWLAEARYVVGDISGIKEYRTFARQYERYYTMSIYSSYDNITYYKYCDADLMFENSYSYYFPGNKFSEYYNSYLAIDLGKRYNLGLLRSYGAVNALDCSLTENVVYSNTDTSDINNVVFDSDHTDARWVCTCALSGDGQTRTIRKLGIYPDISVRRAPGGGYNTDWSSIGRAVTVYEGGNNIALGATVSGSSFFDTMPPDKITDGMYGETLEDVWGSNDESTQWVVIDLGRVYEIYRVKMYHGIMKFDTTTGGTTEDHDCMITDYVVQASEDGAVYDTIFDISDNDAFERIHDLAAPAAARYVRIYITGFKSKKVYYRTASGEYEFFEGAVLREVEVYEYYGFTTVNSEIYPIICINLNDQFYLSDHDLVGIDPESYKLDPRGRTDWVDENSNFCYSDCVLNDPKKVEFKEWAGEPVYDQWVAIKRDVATCYPIREPYTVGYDTFPADAPNYLKHAIIKCIEKPNPCDYHWWWTSRLSTLSNTYEHDVQLCTRSLQIDYPTSSGSDMISLVEGDTFGVDSVLSWRDAPSFRLYIDDINKFDIDYGHFYFGGLDSNNNPVIYKWYFKPFIDAGALNTGWNRLYFRFKTADELGYTESSDDEDLDMRIPRNLTLKTMGLVFRGKGEALTMVVDGFNITRNHFGDSMVFDQSGLYLTGDDYLTCPLAEVDFSAGTIEWWFRPDYNLNGIDYYGGFKNRSLFHFSNSSNDVFGAVVHLNGFIIYYGNINTTLASFVVEELNYPFLDEILHIAIVFSSTGTNIDIDGSTIRLYIDGCMVAKIAEPWEISDSKFFKFILGGQSLLALKQIGFELDSSSVDGVISNLKIYNYCKTDFTNLSASDEFSQVEKLVKPSQLIEISKDNLDFYKVGDHQYLPFIFKEVPVGEVVPIFVRSSIPTNLTGKEIRKSGITIQWNISV